MKLAHLHRKVVTEPVWHVQMAVLAAIVLQFSLDSNLTLGPKYIIAGFESLLLFSLWAITPGAKKSVREIRRTVAITLLSIISVANIFSLGLVVHSLLTNSLVSGHDLIVSGVAIYITNIIVFGLWYWELDSSSTQDNNEVEPADFLFPQATIKHHGIPGVNMWQPTFLDYLYVSVTNATAFSPTDTVPLSHRAKTLMMLQALASLSTVALVAARAVSILA